MPGSPLKRARRIAGRPTEPDDDAIPTARPRPPKSTRNRPASDSESRGPAPARARGPLIITGADTLDRVTEYLSTASGGQRRKRRTYTDEERTDALESLRYATVAEVAANLDIPRGTLERWASAAGVTPYDDLKRQAALAEEAATKRRLIAERSNLTAAQHLEEVVGRLGSYVGTLSAYADDIVQAGRLVDPDSVEEVVADDGSTSLVVRDADYQVAKRRAAAIFGAAPLPFRDAMAGLDRAVVALQLVRGEATSRGTITVEFGIPRPRMSEGDERAELVDITPILDS